MTLDESTFQLFAAKHYENPACHSIEEFHDDLKRFQYLRKLISRYKKTGELKERLILNHIIVIYNCFGVGSTAMLFLKLEGYHDVLAAFLSYLMRMPPTVTYGTKTIDTQSIHQDATIKEVLSKI
jgi:hypothetical protein